MKKSSFIAAAFAAALTVFASHVSLAGEQAIAGVAAGSDQFDKVVGAVKAAGLVDTLGGKGPFTVFAPTDEAFAKLPAERSKACSNLITKTN